jgi:hypothetical protein
MIPQQGLFEKYFELRGTSNSEPDLNSFAEL